MKTITQSVSKAVIRFGCFFMLSTVAFLACAASTDAATLSRPSNNLGLAAYWSFDDATSTIATDFSGNGNAGTLTNMDPTTDWVPGKQGKALDFDGSNDYLGSFGDVLDMRQNDMTIVAWVKIPVGASGYSCLASKSYAGPGNGRWSACISPTGLTYFLMEYGGTAKDEIIGSISVEDDAWHQVALVFDRDSNVRSYIDGVSDGTSSSVAASAGNDMDGAYPLIIGAYGNGAGGAFGNIMNGSMDELRIYNRALTVTEVTSLYGATAAAYKQPNNTGLIGYWSFDDATSTIATDFSGNGKTGTLTNMDPATDWVPGKKGKALDFDGSNDEVLLGNDVYTDAQVGSAGTLSAWFRLTALPGSGQAMSILDIEGYTGNQIVDSSGNARVNVRIYDGAIKNSAGTTNLQTGVWYHYAETWNGTTARVYLNGVEENSMSAGTMNPDAFTRNVVIGRNCDVCGATTRFNGSLDDIRLYGRALSATEIAGLYGSNVQTINSSQNTTNTTLDTGLIGLWSFNGQDVSGTTAYDRSGVGNNGTLTNGPIATIGKVGQGLNFDGTDDYVNTNLASFRLDTAGSMSFWIKSNESGSFSPVISKCTSGVTNGFQIDQQSGKISVNRASSYQSLFPSTATVFDSTWHHVVLTTDGANLAWYVDGEPSGVSTLDSYIDNANTIRFMSQFGGPYSIGTLDEVRVYNRALTAAEAKQLYNLGK